MFQFSTRRRMLTSVASSLAALVAGTKATAAPSAPTSGVKLPARDLATLRAAAVELGEAIDHVNALDARYATLTAGEEHIVLDHWETALERRSAAEVAFRLACGRCNACGVILHGRAYFNGEGLVPDEEPMHSCDAYDLANVIDLD